MADVTIEQVEELASKLSPEDRRTLAARLVSGASEQKEYRNLEGTMKGVWPEDIDLDAELAEIRSAWKKRLGL